LDEPELVYNFMVKGPHTYFVLKVGVLVHNHNCPPLIPDANLKNLDDFATDIARRVALGENIIEDTHLLARAQLTADGTHDALSAFKAANGRGPRTWEEFEAITAGHFASSDEAKAGWQAYQEASQGEEILVIGRRPDTGVVRQDTWPDHRILYISDWSKAANDAWIQGGINRGAIFYVGSPQTLENLWDYMNNRPTVFARELEQLKRAGYIQVNDYIVPPSYKK
jgi:hypothetical protein